MTVLRSVEFAPENAFKIGASFCPFYKKSKQGFPAFTLKTSLLQGELQ
jgi:hypothetical protein